MGSWRRGLGCWARCAMRQMRERQREIEPSRDELRLGMGDWRYAARVRWYREIKWAVGPFCVYVLHWARLFGFFGHFRYCGPQPELPIIFGFSDFCPEIASGFSNIWFFGFGLRVSGFMPTPRTTVLKWQVYSKIVCRSIDKHKRPIVQISISHSKPSLIYMNSTRSYCKNK